MELNINSHVQQLLLAHDAKLVLHHLVVLAVCHEEGCILVGEVLGDVVLDAVAEQEVARETEHAAQLLLTRDAREERHSTTLREASQDDPRRLDTLLNLRLDQ